MASSVEGAAVALRSFSSLPPVLPPVWIPVVMSVVMPGVMPVVLAAMTVLSGCASNPPAPATAALADPPPALATPQTARTDTTLAIERWWTLFDDAALTQRIEQALAHNHDIALAAARSREARARLDEVHAARLPALDLQVQHGRARPAGTDRIGEQHQVALAARYEVDLWGRLAAGDRAAQARLLAQDWAQASVAWSLTAQVAEAHFSLRALDTQLRLGDAMRASRVQTLTMRQREQAAGSASEFELRRAEAELAGTEATLVSLRRQRQALLGTLDLLIGTPLPQLAPSVVDAPLTAVLDTRQRFDARLPQGAADRLLVNRPDLRQAEALLGAAQADVQAARAATLPALRLSGSLGSDAASISQLFSGPGFVWSLAAGLTQPLFDGGANRSRAEQARARGDAALIQYRQAVLAAVVDLRDAYAALDLAEQARQTQSQRAAALGQSRRLAATGVAAGALPAIDLLDAERAHWQAQLDEVSAYRDRLLAQVAVMKALGGGHAGAQAVASTN